MCSKVKDFLTDDDFINYALGVTPEAVSPMGNLFHGASGTNSRCRRSQSSIAGSGRCYLRFFTGR